MIFFAKIVNKIKANPISITFLLIGNIITILTISIGISSILQLQQLSQEKTEGNPQKTKIVSVNLQKKIEFKNLISVFSKLSKDSYIRFNNLFTYVEGAPKDLGQPLTLEYFTQKPDWQYPLMEGNFYELEDIQMGNPVVVIGKNLKKYSYLRNQKRYIKIEGKELKTELNFEKTAISIYTIWIFFVNLYGIRQLNLV